MIGLAVNNAMAGCSSLNLGMNQTCPTNQSDTWNYNNTNQTEPPYYSIWGIHGGYNVGSSNLKDNVNLGAQIGYRFGYLLIGGITFDHMNNHYKDNTGKLTENIIMLNGKYILSSFQTDEFDPYIMAGIGLNIATETLNGVTMKNSGTLFAGEAGLGIDFKLNKKTIIGLDYRYLYSSGKISASRNIAIETNLLTLSFSFLY